MNPHALRGARHLRRLLRSAGRARKPIVFHRLLLAQCEVETLSLVTADRVLAKLPVAIQV